MSQFTEILDRSLKHINSDYDAKRYKDIALQKPIVRSIPIGTFTRWLQKNNKMGGQHKIPRLSNDRKFVEEITSMIGTT